MSNSSYFGVKLCFLFLIFATVVSLVQHNWHDAACHFVWSITAGINILLFKRCSFYRNRYIEVGEQVDKMIKEIDKALQDDVPIQTISAEKGSENSQST